MVSLRVSDLFRKYVGESPEVFANLTKTLKRMVEEHGHAVLYLDEVDTVAESRETSSSISRQILNDILQFMDGIDEGISKGVTIVCSTNRGTILSKAFLDRITHKVDFGMLDAEGLAEVLEQELASRVKDKAMVQINSEGYKQLGMTLFRLDYSGRNVETLIKRVTEEKAFSVIEGASPNPITVSYISGIIDAINNEKPSEF
ncbi:MAG: AAA family ATPase [Bdellovibrionota bacterium]